LVKNRLASQPDGSSWPILDGDAAIVLPDPVTNTAKIDIVNWINSGPLRGWAVYGHGDFTSVGGLMHLGISRDQMLADAADVLIWFLRTGRIDNFPGKADPSDQNGPAGPGENRCSYLSRLYNPNTVASSRVDLASLQNLGYGDMSKPFSVPCGVPLPEIPS